MIVDLRRRDYFTRKGQQGLPKGWRLFQRYPIVSGHPVQLNEQEGSERVLGTAPYTV
jgi:hypothetical protein